MDFSRLERILSSIVELGEETAASLVHNELLALSRERATLSAEEDRCARRAFQRYPCCWASRTSCRIAKRR
jgi:hypothetical protein